MEGRFLTMLRRRRWIPRQNEPELLIKLVESDEAGMGRVIEVECWGYASGSVHRFKLLRHILDFLMLVSNRIRQYDAYHSSRRSAESHQQI